MKNKNKIFVVGIFVASITSYVVFAQNDGQVDVKISEDVEISEVENEVEAEKEEVKELDNKLEGMELRVLEDVSEPIDSRVPSDVGVDAVVLNALRPKYPTIPGFSKKENGIIGAVSNESRTAIQLIEFDSSYELRVGSEVEYDKMVQSYVRQILDYYKDKKYTVAMSGAKVIFKIKK